MFYIKILAMIFYTIRIVNIACQELKRQTNSKCSKLPVAFA